MSLISRYMNWLHTRRPAGMVRKLPHQGSCRIPSFFIRALSVMGFMSRTWAAPAAPLTCQPVCSKALRMCRRPCSSSVWMPQHSSLALDDVLQFAAALVEVPSSW